MTLIEKIKEKMLKLRNDGLVELLPAVDWEHYKPNGSGWSLTQKGLEYVVDNKFVEEEDY